MNINELLSRKPDVGYTDANALADGVLVDLFGQGVKIYFADRPVTRMTTALFDALKPYNSGGSVEAQAAAYTALVAFIVKGAQDTAEDGEPTGVLFQTPDQHALDHHTVWLQANDTTEYEDVPGCDGGWTLMFAADR